MGQAASEWIMPSEEVWQKSSLAFLVHGLICWSWPSVFAGWHGQAARPSSLYLEFPKNVLFCFTVSACCRHSMLVVFVCHPWDAPDCACRNLFRFAVMFHARFAPDHWHQGFLETVMRPASAEWASMCRALACSSCLVFFSAGESVNWLLKGLKTRFSLAEVWIHREIPLDALKVPGKKWEILVCRWYCVNGAFKFSWLMHVFLGDFQAARFECSVNENHVLMWQPHSSTESYLPRASLIR